MEESESLQLLNQKSKSKNDVLLTIVLVLVRFGDAVEIYLPGVITQQISCELDVSSSEEALLGIIMYITMAVSTFLAVPIAKCFGKRMVILASLYISIAATVLCSVVHNYETLIASRALVGFCVGLNNASVNVLFAQMVSSAKMRNLGMFMANFCFAVGGGWISTLGYLLLHALGWRTFIILVSIPWFIPPIIMLHMFLTPKVEAALRAENEEHETATKEIQGPGLSRRTILIRLLKFGILIFVLLFTGIGVVLLLPSLLRASNLSDAVDADGPNERCKGVVGGTQFLIMAGITGGVNLGARCSSIWLFKKFNFRILMFIFSVISTTSFGALTLWGIFNDSPNLILIIITISFIVAAWALMFNETIIVIHDPVTFGAAAAEWTGATIWAVGSFGASAGNAIASFLTPQTAVMVNFVLSSTQIIISLFLTERS